MYVDLAASLRLLGVPADHSTYPLQYSILNCLARNLSFFDKVYDFLLRMTALPEEFGMVSDSVFIYGERHTVVGVGFTMVLNQVATWVFPDVFYPDFIITLAPFIVFFSCQCHINTDRVVSGAPIGSEVNNLCHNFADFK